MSYSVMVTLSLEMFSLTETLAVDDSKMGAASTADQLGGAILVELSY